MSNQAPASVLAIAAALALAGCGGSDAGDDGDDGDVLTSQIDGNSVSVAMSDDGGETLGSVKLPRPDWLPDAVYRQHRTRV